MSDPTGGWAKATEKASEATTEVVRTARDAFTFIADPLRELVGMATDSLKVRRFERQVRFATRIQALMSEQGVQLAADQVPLTISLPIIEQASLEEDDELQDVWAQMLVTAANPDSTSERLSIHRHTEIDDGL